MAADHKAFEGSKTHLDEANSRSMVIETCFVKESGQSQPNIPLRELISLFFHQRNHEWWEELLKEQDLLGMLSTL
eukprot:437802-Amphidinium_carterae.1